MEGGILQTCCYSKVPVRGDLTPWLDTTVVCRTINTIRVWKHTFIRLSNQAQTKLWTTLPGSQPPLRFSKSVFQKMKPLMVHPVGRPPCLEEALNCRKTSFASCCRLFAQMSSQCQSTPCDRQKDGKTWLIFICHICFFSPAETRTSC